MTNEIALKESKPNESRLNNRQKARERRRELEDETYGTLKGDKTPQQCYNWWRRKHLCILRDIRDEKNNHGFAENFKKDEMLNTTRKMLELIKKDL